MERCFTWAMVSVMLTLALLGCLAAQTISGEAPSPASSASTMAAETAIGLERVATGLTAPLALAAPADGTGRLFIADQVGLVRVLSARRELLPTPLLDLRDRLIPLRDVDEPRGLLGLALHPRFGANGRLFVYYSIPLRAGAPAGWNHTNRLSEFRVSPADPAVVDPATERILLEIDWPQANHNGGGMAFGPDGFLYLALGDGGGAGDADPGHPPLGHAQDTTTLLGSILRLDVDGGDPYTLPADNPLLGMAWRSEIYAYGLRHPAHITFDVAGSHALYAGDAGDGQWQEVNLIVAGGNYGWNLRDGAGCFAPPEAPASASCADTGPRGEALVAPLIEYASGEPGRGLGLAVVGGYIYRGGALPELYGCYLFGDWGQSVTPGDGAIWVAQPPLTGGPWAVNPVRITTSADGRLGAYLLGFGEDTARELYLLTSHAAGPSGATGEVWYIVRG